MTLQEKIDKLPLSIEYNEDDYILELVVYPMCVQIYYINQPLDAFDNIEKLFEVKNQGKAYDLSQRLEDVVDRALTIIENKEWERS